jgi:hypothetical protein
LSELIFFDSIHPILGGQRGEWQTDSELKRFNLNYSTDFRKAAPDTATQKVLSEAGFTSKRMLSPAF